jgi:hypothetical protein
MPIGIYPDGSLLAARAARNRLRDLLANGIDPAAHLRKEHAEKRTTEVPAINESAFTYRLKNSST